MPAALSSPVIVGQFAELDNSHGFLLDVDLLVETLFPRHHLADWGWYGQVKALQVITLFSWTPFRRRDDLWRRKEVRKTKLPIYICVNYIPGSEMNIFLKHSY